MQQLIALLIVSVILILILGNTNEIMFALTSPVPAPFESLPPRPPIPTPISINYTYAGTEWECGLWWKSETIACRLYTDGYRITRMECERE